MKQSEIVGNFVKLLDNCEKEYNYNFSQVNEADKATQDLLHKLELGTLKSNEKGHIATEIANVRKDRRYYKNKVDILSPLHELLNNSDNMNSKKFTEKLKQVTGQIKKSEQYLEKRTYKPRVIKEEII